MDVRKRYRCTISFLHYEFERGVERLKEAKTMQDLDILERADVIGMTTTGALYCKLKTYTAAWLRLVCRV